MAAQEGIRASELAGTEATNAAMAGGTTAAVDATAAAGVTADTGAAASSAEQMAGLGADTATGSGQAMLNDALTSSGNAGAQAGQAGPLSFTDSSSSFGLMDAPPVGGGYAQPPGLMETMAAPATQPATIMATQAPTPPGANQTIQEGAMGMDKNSLNKWLTSAQKWASGQSSLYGVSGRDLLYMYGQSKSPEFELIDQRQRMYDQRKANLNAPVALGPTTKG